MASTGNANYNAIEYDPDDMNKVRVKTPFYGYLLFQVCGLLACVWWWCVGRGRVGRGVGVWGGSVECYVQYG